MFNLGEVYCYEMQFFSTHFKHGMENMFESATVYKSRGISHTLTLETFVNIGEKMEKNVHQCGQHSVQIYKYELADIGFIRYAPR